MQLFLFHVIEVVKKGVQLICLSADGAVHILDKPYMPYFYAVNMPVAFRRDIKHSTVEASAQTKPYIGYVDTDHKVIKIRSHTRRMITWLGTHENNVPIARQFSEESGLNPSCWFDLDTMKKIDDQDTIPDFLLCSFDIECYSSTGAFPSADIESNAVVMICLSFQRFSGKGCIHSHVLSLDAASYTNSETTVEQCKTEEELIQRFACVVRQYDPDVLIGYNIDNFDMNYMHRRVQDKEMFYKTLSRTSQPARFSVINTTSVQQGAFCTRRFIIPGRTTIDLLPQAKAYNSTLKYDKKLADLKLDTVGKQVLGSSKTGFTVQEIFKAHETKCPVANQQLVEYNIQDCVLVLQLQTALQCILQLLSLSQISWTSIDDVVHRGQSCRVMNIVSKYAHDAGFYINSPRVKRKWSEIDTVINVKKKKYQGAHCFEPIVDIHTDYILGLDFASLYPSVIRRYNIDPSTLVLAPTDHAQTKRLLTDTDDTFATFVTGTKQAPIPLLLEELGKSRSAVKKQMGKATGQALVILNQRQLAIKVTMNSVYGFLGMTTGPIGRQELAAAVTAYGRDLVRGTAKYILTTYPGAVIVGGDTDSVYCTLPIEKTVAASFTEGHKITAAIEELFGSPISLEMEKVYTPMLYLKKKMYAAIMYTHPIDKGNLDVKGIALARGDSSSLTKRLQLNSINIIMKNPTSAWESIRNLVCTSIATIKDQDKSLLIKSKKLGTNYKHEERQIQINVINKMKARGQAVPNVGERVYYLVEQGEGGVAKRADHPDYVTDIDYQYYIDSQVLKPMKRILYILCKDWKAQVLQQ